MIGEDVVLWNYGFSKDAKLIKLLMDCIYLKLLVLNE